MLLCKKIQSWIKGISNHIYIYMYMFKIAFTAINFIKIPIKFEDLIINVFECLHYMSFHIGNVVTNFLISFLAFQIEVHCLHSGTLFQALLASIMKVVTSLVIRLSSYNYKHLLPLPGIHRDSRVYY